MFHIYSMFIAYMCSIYFPLCASYFMESTEENLSLSSQGGCKSLMFDAFGMEDRGRELQYLYGIYLIGWMAIHFA